MGRRRHLSLAHLEALRASRRESLPQLRVQRPHASAVAEGVVRSEAQPVARAAREDERASSVLDPHCRHKCKDHIVQKTYTYGF